MPDGAYCNANLTSVCIGGACITEPIPKPTTRPTKRPTPTATNRPSIRPSPRPSPRPSARPTRRPSRVPTRVGGRRQLSAATAGNLTILNPLPGETLYNGDAAIIRWQSSVPLLSADVQLSDGTVIILQLTNNEFPLVSTEMSYYWLVNAPIGPGYTITVTGYPDGGGSPIVGTSPIFIINDHEVLTLTGPVGGQKVTKGEPIQIT